MQITRFQTKLALGSDATFVLVGESADMLDMLLAKLWRATFEFEQRFSRFLPDSELSAFNRSAGIKQAVSPEFRDILRTTQQLAIMTDGLYNPFILPALQRAGYTTSFVKEYASDVHDDHSSRQVVAASNVEVGDTWACIPYGTALDLGGCGKGYLGDQLAELLRDEPLNGYWLSLGGDISAAGCDEHGQPWTVAIQDAGDTTTESAYVVQGTVEPFAVATSSTLVRQGTHNGKRWHHIIDPATGQPADSDVRMATVHAATALQADVLASCAIILSSNRALAYLGQRHVIGALLQVEDKRRAIHALPFGTSIYDTATEVPRYA